jgi:hypothetical protein
LVSIEALLKRLQEKGYKLKLSKCRFLMKKAEFTGVQVTKDGIAVLPEKLDTVTRMKTPKIMSEVKSLLGFTSFLRAHIRSYCNVVSPIQAILTTKIKEKQGKNINIEHLWTTECDNAWAIIKKLLLDEKRVLAFPDSNKRYVLYTDASKLAMSAVLMQEYPEGMRPVGYWSKAFKGSQLNWAALVKEARGVVEAVQNFSVFIAGCKILLRCDHKPLERFLERKTKNEMVNRWSMLIQEYDIEFLWVSTDENLSDYLSRLGTDSLSQKHDEVGNEFPTWPQSAATIDQGVQTSESKSESEVYAAQIIARRDQIRRTLSDKDEAKLYGLPDGVEVRKTINLTDAEVKLLQSKDNYCKRILNRSDSFKEENGTFQVKGGLLYKHVYQTHPGSERIPSLALVIPKCLTLSVIVSLHKELKHAGRDKLLAAMRTRVYWKRMSVHVADFVRCCKICQFRHLKNSSYQHMRIKPPKGPGTRLAIDLWSAAGHTALTAIDLMSQYPFAEPVKSNNVRHIIYFLLAHLSYVADLIYCLNTNKGDNICRQHLG